MPPNCSSVLERKLLVSAVDVQPLGRAFTTFTDPAATLWAMSSSTRLSDATNPDEGTLASGTSAAAAAQVPEIAGTLRDCTPNAKGSRKLRGGDIAIINNSDLSRREAQFLIDAAPAAVVNASSFSTGAVPNYGPLMLLDANIPLFEAAGAQLLANFRDGAKKGRIDPAGTVFNGKNQVATSRQLSRENAEAAFGESQQALGDRIEAYFGNTIQFVHSESPLLIDGLGIPDVGDEMLGRKVLVVSPGERHRSEIKSLRNFIREFDPVLIGVDSAADTLVELGYDPSYVVGDPADIGADTLRSGARVILPADPDGHAHGLERIQDLGVGAMTFPAAIESSTDLALLLAADHGAELIVNAGSPLSLDDIFADREQATPGALLTRMRLGGTLVDASAITKLYSLPGGEGSLAWLWALLGILVAVAVIILVIGLGGGSTFTQNMIDMWDQIEQWFQGLFS